MRSRSVALILAVVLGVVATLGLVVYIRLVTTATDKGRKVNVYVAKVKISPGKSLDEMLADDEVEKRAVPRRYLPETSVTSRGQVKGRVLTVAVNKDEHLTTSNFKSVKEEGALPLKLEKDQLAITVPVDQFSGVGDELNPGDKIVIFASFEGPTEEAAQTMMLLSNVEVLSAPTEKKKTGAGSTRTEKEELMVAISAEQAEKLVFATENGKIWAALQPKDTVYKETTQTTVGATYGTIFQGDLTAD